MIFAQPWTRQGGGDAYDLGRGVEVDEALVDAHLEAVVGVGTLTARGLAGHDLEVLGRDADRALNVELLVLGTGDEEVAHLENKTTWIMNCTYATIDVATEAHG